MNHDQARVAVLRAALLTALTLWLAWHEPVARVAAGSCPAAVFMLWMNICRSCVCCSGGVPSQLTVVISGVTDGVGAGCTNCEFYNGTFVLDVKFTGDTWKCGTVSASCLWVYYDDAADVNCTSSTSCDNVGAGLAVGCQFPTATPWTIDIVCNSSGFGGAVCRNIINTGSETIRSTSLAQGAACTDFEDEAFSASSSVSTTSCNFLSATILVSA